MELLRRFLVLQAFMLWQGGFVFYAAVVVPIGTELFTARDQGFVTQQVTNWLNYFGVAWCVIYFLDLLVMENGLFRWMGWILNVMLLVGLYLIHQELDSVMDDEIFKINDPDRFRRLHISYLWFTTIHWLISLLLLALTIRAWHNHDRQIFDQRGTP